jgi:N-alpha-acetyl-L-2,4-diaminobutyrate deacetylase
MPSADCFAFAEEDGLAAFNRDLGAPVAAGDVVVRLYPHRRTGIAPHDVRAAIDGVLAARHVPGLAKAGDCLFVIATAGDGP